MFVDALNFRKEEIIRVVERVNGKRVYKEYKPDWHFFVNDPKGTHKSIYGDTVKKIQPRSRDERTKLIKQFSTKKKWESDANVVFRMLEHEYQHKEAPVLNTAFFDIETDFDEKRGYSEPKDALNPITSIAVYLQWMDQMICIAVPPPTLTWEEALAIGNQVPDVILVKTEKEMLDMFLDLIEDADVLSGWNSEAYDIPYTINRVIKLLGKSETRRMCLWDQTPTSKLLTFGGRETPSYDLCGRVHLDYMQLYKKYTYEERHSYALNAIAEVELGEQKVQYDGTLDGLYKNDFKLFLEYNIQDTYLLDRLDKELQYIDLSNTIAHGNGVLIPNTIGTVAMIDQAAMIEAHERGMVAPDKKRGNIETRAAGGWVAVPKKGLHKWIGSADLNSLYPSVIRALNMSPETIIGQIDLSKTNQAIHEHCEASKKNSFATWWNDRFCPLEMENYFGDDISTILDLTFEDGQRVQLTGKGLKELVFEGGQPWAISANGTIFRHDIVGVIPGLLTRWYSERKLLQAQKRFYGMLVDSEKNEGIKVPDFFDASLLKIDAPHISPFVDEEAFQPKELEAIIETGLPEALADFMNAHQLIEKDGKFIYRNQEELKGIQGFWDKRQLVKKINLNSAYGALLNVGSRFFDQRIGQSTTLTSRNITKHMAAKTNEYITGVYDHYGECIIYGDTDSTYFSAYPALKDEIDSGAIDWNKESVAEIYDKISDDVSDTFPQFMAETFCVPYENADGVIKSGREIVAESALFIKKKRYAALVYDDEGTRRDINGKAGKVKAMGLDLRRSDTPKYMQEFLSEILLDTLLFKGEEAVVEKVTEFKKQFDAKKPWEKGSPKGCNNLTKYKEKEEMALVAKMQGRKADTNMPGHVRAALNWNHMRDMHNDFHVQPVVDGQKVIVCKLKESANNTYSSIAYPVDITALPTWFTDLPFDEPLMMETIVDKKIDNLVGVLKWDLSKTSKESVHMSSLFDMSGMS